MTKITKIFGLPTYPWQFRKSLFWTPCRLITMNISSLTQISGKPRCTGFWAWGENHGRAVELYRESIEATQVARCPDYLDYVALMTLTIKWRRRLKTTVEYKTTSTGLRYNPPILEMLHVLLWDDCKRWVIPLWWNIPTDDTQYVCCNFNLILSLKQQISILNIMWAPWKVPMVEDVLTNGRPVDGFYFLTTNREEPRSYNSYE